MSDTEPASPAAASAQARDAGLRYVSPREPGLRRVRQGRGFQYLDAAGQPVHDAETLLRIQALAIPPAYEDVWICADPCGHLQAVGRDARGRRQYRYHARWRQTRDGAKFGRMAEFARALPRLRRRLRQDLAQPGLSQDKVLAAVVALLDDSLARIGNPEYARDNGSFGLTTLRNRHATFIGDGRAVLQFRGKGGTEHEIVVGDRRLAAIVRRCRQIPGQQLFQYLGDDGERHPVDSGLVNAYIARHMGEGFTAKDFRTWGATRRALVLLCGTPLPTRRSEAALSRGILATVRQVAHELRNTPAVCRKSYINPAVFDAWRAGRLQGLNAPGERAVAAVLQELERAARRGTGRRAAASKRGLHENRRPRSRANPARHARLGQLGRRQAQRAQP